MASKALRRAGRRTPAASAARHLACTGLLAAATLAWTAGAAAQARLTAALDPPGKNLVLTLGPVELPPGATHHQVLQPVAQEIAIPRDGWLRGYELELVDAAGRRVPQLVLHHLNLILPGRRELFSPIMHRLGAAGHETAPVLLPRLMGFKVRRGDRLLVTAMFANESRQAYQGVQLRVRLPFTGADTWLPPMSVYPFYIDVMPPAGIHEYDLPAGRSQKSWDARPAVAARILGVGGHLHKYGTLLRFEDVTEGKVLWEAKPRLDERGNVVAIPTSTFWWRGGVKVVPDHVYRLTAFYDNPTGRMIPGGAMGTFGGILVPVRGSVWPALDRRDPEFIKDVQVTRGGMQMQMEGEGVHVHDHGAVKAAPPRPASVPRRGGTPPRVTR